MPTSIKQIQLSDGAHELDAKYWNGHEWKELGSAIKFIGTGQTTAPTAYDYVIAVIGSTTYYIPQDSKAGSTAAEIPAKKGDVFILTSPGKEYLCTKGGSGTSTSKSTWAELGDESSYALKTVAGKAGPHISGDASSTTTGSGGAQTATGTATITYKKSDAATGSAGEGGAASTGSGGAVSIAYTPSGSITGSQTISAHSHNVSVATATINIVTDSDETVSSSGSHTHTVTGKVTAAGSISVGSSTVKNYTPAGSISAVTASAHSHTVNAATDSVVAVTGINSGSGSFTQGVDTFTPNVPTTIDVTKFSGGTQASYTQGTFSQGTLPSFTQGSRASFIQGSKAILSYTARSNVMSAPTVSTAGVLSWTLTTADDITGWTTNGDDSFTANGDDTFSAGTLPSHGSDSFTKNTVASLGAGFYSAGSAASFKQGTDAHSHTGASIKTTKACTYMTGATLNTAGGINVTPTFTGTGVDLKFTGSQVDLASGSAASAGTHDHELRVWRETLTYATGSATLNTAGGATIDFTKASFNGASVTLSQASHTHSYTKPTAHTHSIGLTDTSATGTAAVAVTNHTHSMSHTHTTTVPNCA